MHMKIKVTKFLFYAAVTLGVASLLISLVLGDSQNPAYFWGALTAIPFTGIGIFLYYRWDRLRNLQVVRDQWGMPTKRKRNFISISHYFRSSKIEADKALVDDNTWDDLNMNDLFSQIDRTFTGPGEAVLYHLLRTPCTQESAPELRHRDKIITILQENSAARERLQMALLRMPRDDSNTITHLLWDKLPPKNPLAFLYSLLGLAALLVLPTPFLLGSEGIILIMAVFSVNSIVHYKVRKKYSFHIPSITSLAGLLRSAQGITRESLPGMEQEQQQLKKALSSTKKISRVLRNLFFDSAPSSEILFFVQYIQILFLVEVRSFYGALEEIRRQLKELRNIYYINGLLDAMQAVASYREGLAYVEPKFTSAKCLKVAGIRHPLLSNPVSNSIDIQNQGILITGSNMAGKSTFLRTLGLNVVLAQTINICLADAYTASFLQVASSINKADDISQQKSLYYAEAERLFNIISPDYQKLPALYIIDELLSGTNYTERLAASGAILNYLKSKNALVVVATHDLDLAENLGESYQCYHFSDKVDKNNLKFDYKLKRGIATTRNAIKLLEHLGYPKEIIEQANNQ